MPITKKIVGGMFDDAAQRIKDTNFQSVVYCSMKELILDLGWERCDAYYTSVENKQKVMVKVKRDPYETNQILTHQVSAKARLTEHRENNGTEFLCNLPTF